MNIRPTGDNIVVAPIEENETTAAGIILPQAAKDKPERGTVLAVGPGRILSTGERASMDVVVGETVVYTAYAPKTLKLGDEDVVVLEASDVIAVID